MSREGPTHPGIGGRDARRPRTSGPAHGRESHIRSQHRRAAARQVTDRARTVHASRESLATVPATTAARRYRDPGSPRRRKLVPGFDRVVRVATGALAPAYEPRFRYPRRQLPAQGVSSMSAGDGSRDRLPGSRSTASAQNRSATPIAPASGEPIARSPR